MARQRSASRKQTRRRPGEGSWGTTRTGVRYRVPVGHHADGRAILKDFYGRDRAEALEKHRAWMAEHPSGPPTVDQLQPLNNLLAAYIEAAIRPPAGAESTYRNHLGLIRRHIAPTIGQRPLVEVTLYRINEWLRELYEKTGKGRTVEQCRNIVRAALNYAVKAGTIPSNPAEHATVPEFQRRKARTLTVAQAQALLDAAGGRLDLRRPVRAKDGTLRRQTAAIETRLECLYLLAVTTGLRRGELLALRYSDIEWEQAAITIARTIDTRGKEQHRTKTEASAATIYLDELLVAALKAHRARMQAEGHGEGWKPDGLVFPTTTGQIMLPSNLNRHYKGILEAAGITDPCPVCKGSGGLGPMVVPRARGPRVTQCPNCEGHGVLTPTRFHDLRHSAGSLMLAEGGTIADVSRTLRHATTAVTAKIYLHGSDEGSRKAVGGVSRRVGKKEQ